MYVRHVANKYKYMLSQFAKRYTCTRFAYSNDTRVCLKYSPTVILYVRLSTNYKVVVRVGVRIYLNQFKPPISFIRLLAVPNRPSLHQIVIVYVPTSFSCCLILRIMADLFSSHIYSTLRGR